MLNLAALEGVRGVESQEQLSRILEGWVKSGKVREVPINKKWSKYVVSADFERIREIAEQVEGSIRSIDKAIDSINIHSKGMTDSQRKAEFAVLLYGISISMISVLHGSVIGGKKWEDLVDAYALALSDKWKQLLRSMHSDDASTLWSAIHGFQNSATRMSDDSQRHALQEFLVG